MQQLVAAACAHRVDLLMSMARTPSVNIASLFPRLISKHPPRRWCAPTTPSRKNMCEAATYALPSNGDSCWTGCCASASRVRKIDVFADTASALHAVERGTDDVYFGFHARRAALPWPNANSPVSRWRSNVRGRVREIRFAVPRDQIGWRDALNLGLAVMQPAQIAAISRALARRPRSIRALCPPRWAVCRTMKRYVPPTDARPQNRQPASRGKTARRA